MNWWTRLLDFISPRLCVVCGKRLAPTERSVCSACLLHFPRTTYQFTPEDNPMAQLFWHLAPIERAAAYVYYEPHSEMAQIIYQLKYGERPDIGEDMGRLMAVEMEYGRFFEGIDVLLPVPLSRKRQRNVVTTKARAWPTEYTRLQGYPSLPKPYIVSILFRVKQNSVATNAKRMSRICFN